MNILLTCQVNNLLSSGRLDIRGVDNSRLHKIQTLVCCVEQKVKRFFGDFLIVLVIGNHASEEVRGKDFCRQKMFLCKCGFTA